MATEKKIHLRAYKGAHLTVCGLSSVGRVGLFSTCKTCLMFDGKNPPANYAELTGYGEYSRDVIKNDENFSTDNENEMEIEKAKSATPELSYSHYKHRQLRVKSRALPAKQDIISKDRSRIINDAVEFNFGEPRKIPQR